MPAVKENVNSFVEHAQQFSISGGVADSAFKKWHMSEIKRIEQEICSSEQIDEYLNSLRKYLTHHNRSVRERTAYLSGELMLLSPESKEVTQSVKKLLECTREEYFEPVNTTGREIVNALGKSCRAEAENSLLQLLSNPKTKSIRPNILVALGKTGGKSSVQVLADLMKMRLDVSDMIHVLWALGRLGSVQNNARPGFPLPRSSFEQPLDHMFRIIQGPLIHPTVHYCAIYAVGELCDQRDRRALEDSLSLSTLEKAEEAISLVTRGRSDILKSMKKHQKLRYRAEFHTQNLVDISEKVALKMIRGQKLDPEGERILFNVRILFEVISSPETSQEFPAVLAVMENNMQDSLPTYAVQEPERDVPVSTCYSTDHQKEKSLEKDSSIARTEQSEQHIPSQEMLAQPAEVFITSPFVNAHSIFGSKEELQEEFDHQLALRKELIKRLRPLELQKARKGIGTPAEVITEIDEINKTLVQIETRIKALKQDLDVSS